MRRVTYAPYTAGVMGALIGILVWASTGSATLGIITFIVVGVIVFFLVRLFENALYKAGEKAADAIQKAHDRKHDASHPHQMQSLAERYSGNTETAGNAGTMEPVYQGYNSWTSLDSNQWRCPVCNAINPKFVGTCSCGLSLEKWQEEEKKRAEERKKHAKLIQEKEQEELKEWSDIYIKAGATDKDLLAIKMLLAESSGLTSQEMSRKLPRSANIQEFKSSLEHLEQINAIEKNMDGKYLLKPITDDKASSEDIREISH